MAILEFLTNCESTTSYFKRISDKYQLDVLQHGIKGNVFQRLVLIHVDDVPVMFGFSETRLDNANFLNILQNAGNTPIGLSLFAKNTSIARANMEVKQIDIVAVSHPLIVDYLTSQKIIGKIYCRQSCFVDGDETLQLKEYILPGLLELLSQ